MIHVRSSRIDPLTLISTGISASAPANFEVKVQYQAFVSTGTEGGSNKLHRGWQLSFAPRRSTGSYTATVQRMNRFLEVVRSPMLRKRSQKNCLSLALTQLFFEPLLWISSAQIICSTSDIAFTKQQWWRLGRFEFGERQRLGGMSFHVKMWGPR